jgi:hypothetical protein
MSTEAFEWFVLLAAWFALFGVGAAALGAYEWWLRHRSREVLPKPGGRARIYRADPPSVSRWGSTR